MDLLVEMDQGTHLRLKGAMAMELTQSETEEE
jgi:hypothetical protein